MENWGLITFRETELLVGEKNSSVHNVKSVSLTIAHELSHMWFGNLVTMKWWDDLWLNEGFATYMEHVAVDSVFPQWNQVYHSPTYNPSSDINKSSRSTASFLVSCVRWTPSPCSPSTFP